MAPHNKIAKALFLSNSYRFYKILENKNGRRWLKKVVAWLLIQAN